MNALISHLVPEKQIAPIEQRELLGNLRLKQEQFQEAANLALGLSVSVDVAAAVAPNAEEAFMAVPGQTFGASVRAILGIRKSRYRISTWICPKDGKPLQRPGKY